MYHWDESVIFFPIEKKGIKWWENTASVLKTHLPNNMITYCVTNPKFAVKLFTISTVILKCKS